MDVGEEGSAFHHSSASVYYTEHKPTKEQKLGRPGNKASKAMCSMC